MMRLLTILIGAKSAPACIDEATLAVGAFRRASVRALHVIVDLDVLMDSGEEIGLQHSARSREAELGSAQRRPSRLSLFAGRADVFDIHRTEAYHDEARRIAATRDAVRSRYSAAAFVRLCQLHFTSRLYRDHCTSTTK